MFFYEKIEPQSEKKTISIEEKSQQLQYNKLLPDRSYHKLGVHLSLKQILRFFMRKKEVNPMQCDCPIPFEARYIWLQDPKLKIKSIRKFSL
jgi:hypothetical protein